MPQVARPSSDVANTGWTPTPVYPHVNTVTPNDGSPVASPVPLGGSFDVQLRPLARPSGLPQTLTVRLDESLPGSALVTFLLLQASTAGITTVAGLSVSPTGTLTNYDLPLTSSDIALISDYTNLRVRVIAAGDGTGSAYGSGSGSRISPGVMVPCCAGVQLPTTLHATFQNISGCACLDGLVVALTWDGIGSWKIDHYGLPGCCQNCVLLMEFACTGANPQRFFSELSCGVGANIQAFTPDPGASCSPLNVVFNNVSFTATGTACCGGTVRVTVTL